ncbi:MULTISPECIES: P-type ATPase [Arthrobacter]|uniref:P-type ATPase n=1 Tax=unclassified Arthrobacter TaxID=235627 RepID=UPI0024B9DA89|nr:hypothetical protein [Arthrobacter sp. H35-MC1]MDJ0318845.1 hypothetical protein [Arthrobacter sp. H35-MC1]
MNAGNCVGVVVATGGRAEFGKIALGVGEHQPQTEFQHGLKRFSFLLLQVALALTALIFLTNLLGRPFLVSLLFSPHNSCGHHAAAATRRRQDLLGGWKPDVGQKKSTG